MYIEDGHTYYKGGEQRHSRSRFLLLIQKRSEKTSADNMYACVRTVSLRQYGHFMMGTARIGNKSVSVSGSYGNDGLPMDVDEIPPDAVSLPQELYDVWNKGGGWNSAGSEAEAMRKWALETFKKRKK